MPRLISFAKTADQVKAKQKTVTRREGWEWLEAGTLLKPVDKVMGFEKGESPQPLFDDGTLIRVADVRREPLNAIIDHDRACERCGGSGFIVECDRCDAHGWVEGWCIDCDGFGCRFCGGSGVDQHNCSECGGDPRKNCPGACYHGFINDETTAEGFCGMPGEVFVDFFCDEMGVEPEGEVTRIEFEYVEEGGDR